MGADAPVKVIYIAGYGRSGSTILDITLGQHGFILGAGEVTAMTRHVWDGNEYCACGSAVRDCPLWARVVGQWQAGEDADFLPQYRIAQELVESILSWRRLLRIAPTRASYTRFVEQTTKLFQILQTVSGRQVVLDSSKMPGRAFALAALPSVELYVIHLVRDGRAVVWSMMRPFKRDLKKGLQKELEAKPLVYTALRWMVVNVAAQLLCWKLGARRSVRIRYEDFVADPDKTVKQVITMIRPIDAETVSLHESTIFPQHQVAGSRHRMQQMLTIEQDERWRSEMPRSNQLAVSFICAPLMLLYGYMRWPGKRGNLREALTS